MMHWAMGTQHFHMSGLPAIADVTFMSFMCELSVPFMG